MKVLIGVITCHTRDYKEWSNKDHPNERNDRLELIRETWKKLIPENVDVRFFKGISKESPREDEVFLKVPDGYFDLHKKVQAAIIWALDNGYDYFFKCDDDTFLNPAIFKSDIFNYDYSGFAIDQGDYKFVSGFLYLLNKKSMLVIKQELMPTEERVVEDQYIGQVLTKAGIVPHNDIKFRGCICPLCWNDDIIKNKDYYGVQVNPKFELMKQLYLTY